MDGSTDRAMANATCAPKYRIVPRIKSEPTKSSFFTDSPPFFLDCAALLLALDLVRVRGEGDDERLEHME